MKTEQFEDGSADVLISAAVPFRQIVALYVGATISTATPLVERE